MEEIRSTKPITRKEHECNYCKGTIEIGEKYLNTVLKYDYIYSWKSHINCQRLVGILNTYNISDGVDSEDFSAMIVEEFQMINKHKERYFTFEEKLKIVSDKYFKNETE